MAGPPPNLAILAWTDPVAIVMLVGAGMMLRMMMMMMMMMMILMMMLLVLMMIMMMIFLILRCCWIFDKLKFRKGLLVALFRRDFVSRRRVPALLVGSEKLIVL